MKIGIVNGFTTALKCIFVGFLIIMGQLKVSACDCDSPPRTFINSLSAFTASLEVVQIDTLSQEGVYQFRPLLLTKLKVIKTFKGSDPVEYVWMNNANGASCERGLFPTHVGQKYIVTGSIIEDKRYETWIDDSTSRNFLHVTTCGKTILDIEDQDVIGVITVNNEKKIKETYDRFMKEDASKAQAYYKEIYQTKHHKELVQKIPMKQFYRLMEE